MQTLVSLSSFVAAHGCSNGTVRNKHVGVVGQHVQTFTLEPHIDTINGTLILCTFEGRIVEEKQSLFIISGVS